MKKTKRNWLIFSAAGLATIGFGLSLMGEALLMKYEQAAFWQWFGWGTLALIVTNSGMALFGKAVTLRCRLDRFQDENQN